MLFLNSGAIGKSCTPLNQELHPLRTVVAPPYTVSIKITVDFFYVCMINWEIALGLKVGGPAVSGPERRLGAGCGRASAAPVKRFL